MHKSHSHTGDHVVPEPNPFLAGQSAAKQGKAISVSPYKKGSREWVRWLNGYQYQRNVMNQPAATYTKELD